MKLFYITFFTFCTIFSSFGQKITDLNTDLNSAINYCGDCLNDENLGHKANSFTQQINDINNELKKWKGPPILRDWILVQIQTSKAKILANKIDTEKPTWTDTDRLGDLRDFINNYLIVFRIKYSDPLKGWKKIEKLSSSDRKKFLKMVGGYSDYLDFNFYEKYIWPVLYQNVEQQISNSESLLFKLMTPDQTRYQFEEFLSFAVYRDGIYFSNAYDAFLSIFIDFTSDGEFESIQLFGTYVRSKTLRLWNLLLDRLLTSDFYNLAKQRASAASSILNTNNVEETKLEDIVLNNPEKEVSIVALQKLIHPFLNSGDFYGALKYSQNYNDLYSSIPDGIKSKEKFIVLQNFLSQLNNFGFTGHQQISGDINKNNSHELEFIMQREDNDYLAVLELGRAAKVNSFHKDENGIWKFVKSIPRNPQNFFHFITPSPQHPIDFIESNPRTNIYNQSSVSGKFNADGISNLDFFIDLNNGIAVFASTSQHERLEVDKSEFISSGVVNSNVKTQFNSNSKGFHGKRYGNANYDLYVSFLVSGGQSWTPPSNILDINTPFCERSPIISADGRTLYFASEGHPGLGGFDMFEVPIIREGNRMRAAPNQLKNLCSINSPADELFYYPLESHNQMSQGAIFSSNKYGDFDLFELTEPCTKCPFKGDPIGFIEETNPVEQKSIFNEPSNKVVVEEKDELPEDWNPLLPWRNDKIYLDLECLHKSDLKLVVPEKDRISIQGRVYDHKKRPVKSADLVFYSKHNGGVRIKVKEGDQGAYQGSIKDSTRYQVTIIATTVDNQKVTEVLTEFITICDNPQNEFGAYKDFITESSENAPPEGIEFGMPFFFAYDEHQTVLSNLDILETDYQILLVQLSKNSDLNVILEGFADSRGSREYNLELSRKRCVTAKWHLRRWGFGSDRIDTLPKGEDGVFHEDLDDYQEILPESVFNNDENEKKFQLHRRVQIRVSANKNKILTNVQTNSYSE